MLFITIASVSVQLICFPKSPKWEWTYSPNSLADKKIQAQSHQGKEDQKQQSKFK